jgi:hypothetical protein
MAAARARQAWCALRGGLDQSYQHRRRRPTRDPSLRSSEERILAIRHRGPDETQCSSFTPRPSGLVLPRRPGPMCVGTRCAQAAYINLSYDRHYLGRPAGRRGQQSIRSRPDTLPALVAFIGARVMPRTATVRLRYAFCVVFTEISAKKVVRLAVKAWGLSRLLTCPAPGITT